MRLISLNLQNALVNEEIIDLMIQIKYELFNYRARKWPFNKVNKEKMDCSKITVHVGLAE